jgi:hypothetical protein
VSTGKLAATQACREQRNVLISGAECAQLRKTAFLCTSRNLAGICAQHSSKFLRMFLVLCPRVALPQTPVHAHLQRLDKILVPSGNHSLATHSDYRKQ